MTLELLSDLLTPLYTRNALDERFKTKTFMETLLISILYDTFLHFSWPIVELVKVLEKFEVFSRQIVLLMHFSYFNTDEAENGCWIFVWNYPPGCWIYWNLKLGWQSSLFSFSCNMPTCLLMLQNIHLSMFYTNWATNWKLML